MRDKRSFSGERRPWLSQTLFVTGVFAFAAMLLVAVLYIPASIYFNRSDGQAQTNDWADAPWQGNDAPFKRARAMVESAIWRSTDPSAGVAKYRSAALLAPNNQLAVFCWAVALVAPRKHGVGVDSNDDAAKEIVAALAVPLPPYTCSYMRIRYYIDVNGHFQDPQLKALGERLLAANPDDYSVLIGVGTSCLDTQRSLSLLNKAVRLRTSDPTAYWALGMKYMKFIADNEYDEEDCRKALRVWKKYLTLEPKSNEGYYSAAVDAVSFIEEKLKAVK